MLFWRPVVVAEHEDVVALIPVCEVPYLALPPAQKKQLSGARTVTVSPCMQQVKRNVNVVGAH